MMRIITTDAEHCRFLAGMIIRQKSSARNGTAHVYVRDGPFSRWSLELRFKGPLILGR